MGKKCISCHAVKDRSEFRLLPSGRPYRRCLVCHVPRTERRPRAFYKSAAYKRERREVEARKQGRKLRPFRVGRDRTALTAEDVSAIRCFASLYAMALLVAAPRADAAYAKTKADRRRLRWIASRQARRGRERSQSDGTLTTDIVQRLFDGATRCAHCKVELTRRNGARYQKSDATMDHVIPLSRGGIHGISNVVIACAACNFRRHDRLIEEMEGCPLGPVRPE